MHRQLEYRDADASNPNAPSGHARAVKVSTRLTTEYRKIYRKHAVDVTPEQVVECLVAAGVTEWVLMGLHGYAGYLPMPRATQDVDVLVSYREKSRAVRALAERWPMLVFCEYSQLVRFVDPGDVDAQGTPQPVIDLMLPWGKFQTSILQHHVHVDPATGHRIPSVEAAIVSKYAAMISVHRERDRREQDAVDLRRIVRANLVAIDRDRLIDLAAEVWEKGGEEIVEFLRLATENKPFPI